VIDKVVDKLQNMDFFPIMNDREAVLASDGTVG